VPVTTAPLHSDISPEDCFVLKQRHPNRKYIKLIHVIDETSLHIQDPYLDIVDALLLGTVNPSTGQIGGTGLAHDWSLSARLVASSPPPVILTRRLDRGQCEFRYRRSSSRWSRC
jgi:phosphoribosylanthranilate isomerase